MTSDRIIATMAYMTRREENVWNISVLQRAHFSSLEPEFSSVEIVGLGKQCQGNMMNVMQERRQFVYCSSFWM
jgi:hypothetical protein